MRILTVNAGSTSLKLEIYALTAPRALADPPAPDATVRVDGHPDSAMRQALEHGVDVVAHRFVHLPADAGAVLRLDEAARDAIAAAAADAPLHDRAALSLAHAIAAARPELPQYAVADGTFHRTLSPAASTYAIPRALTLSGLRRLGYHGLSHEYAAHRAAALAGISVGHARIVTLHLGGGSSLCAVREGRSIDTTMGFTPLDGVPMATRSGSVDPGLLIHLLRGGMTVDALEDMLQHRSGLAGISGRSGDVRELLAAAAADDGARLALDVLAWRVRAALGAMIGVLGGIDLIAFTGGIGEHAAGVRAEAVPGAAACGASLDSARNAALAGEGCISAAESRIGVYVVAARENWQLARIVFAAIA